MIQPPYLPQGAAIGGMPTVAVDVAPLSVFIFLYLTSAVINIVIFQTNLRKGHKFIISGLLVGFSMARVLTCTLRIVWSVQTNNISLVSYMHITPFLERLVHRDLNLRRALIMYEGYCRRHICKCRHPHRLHRQLALRATYPQSEATGDWMAYCVEDPFPNAVCPHWLLSGPHYRYDGVHILHS